MSEILWRIDETTNLLKNGESANSESFVHVKAAPTLLVFNQNEQHKALKLNTDHCPNLFNFPIILVNHGPQ